ncbi:hypothetical protein GW17_00000511 [Ensete ventricosum]|nr:hypothetical protein GW17_00000511 [Ensete ventricosum]
MGRSRVVATRTDGRFFSRTRRRNVSPHGEKDRGDAIPHAVALVRASDRKSPREAIEFVLQLLKVKALYQAVHTGPPTDRYADCPLPGKVCNTVSYRSVRTGPIKDRYAWYLSVLCVGMLDFQVSDQCWSMVGTDMGPVGIGIYHNTRKGAGWEGGDEGRSGHNTSTLSHYINEYSIGLSLYQGILFLSSLLKRIDQLMQFDRFLLGGSNFTCLRSQEPLAETVKLSEALPTAETVREGDTVSNCSERRVNVIKIRVKQRSSSSKADDVDHQMEYSRGRPNDAELGPCSSVSVDAPARGATEPFNISSQNNEEVSSSHDRESRMTASIGSAKLVGEDKLGKELQCTADSRLDALSKDQLSPNNINVEETVISKTACLQDLSVVRHDGEVAMPPENDEELKEKRKKEKKDKERKRRRDDKVHKKDDPEYIEKKRLKKERKRKEKELAKMHKGGDRSSSDMKISSRPSESRGSLVDSKVEPGVEIHALKNKESISETAQGSFTSSKFRIKIKSRNTDNS